MIIDVRIIFPKRNKNNLVFLLLRSILLSKSSPKIFNVFMSMALFQVGNYSHKNGDHTADNALKELLKTDPDTDSLTEGRRKSQPNSRRILVK